jgi:hypothetical protein
MSHYQYNNPQRRPSGTQGSGTGGNIPPNTAPSHHNNPGNPKNAGHTSGFSEAPGKSMQGAWNQTKPQEKFVGSSFTTPKTEPLGNYPYSQQKAENKWPTPSETQKIPEENKERISGANAYVDRIPHYDESYREEDSSSKQNTECLSCKKIVEDMKSYRKKREEMLTYEDKLKLNAPDFESDSKVLIESLEQIENRKTFTILKEVFDTLYESYPESIEAKLKKKYDSDCQKLATISTENIQELKGYIKELETKKKAHYESIKLKLEEQIIRSQELEKHVEYYSEELKRSKEKLEEFSPPSPFLSKGLKNIGNSCYMNSILQVLAHFSTFCNLGFSSPLSKALFNLLEMMQDKKIRGSKLETALHVFYEQLLADSEDFVRGREQDPKYLIIHLQKRLLEERIAEFKLIRWSKEITFQHDYYYTKHLCPFPEQVISVFSVSPGYSRVYYSDFSKLITLYVSCSNYKVEGFCEKCNKSVQGNETITRINPGNYTAFCISTSDYSCVLQEMKSFTVAEYEFNLIAIIVRQNQGSFAHNFAICREGETWVMYNDSDVSIYERNEVANVYMFFYEVIAKHRY